MESFSLRPLAWLGHFANDLRYGLRQLAAAPSFTAVALASLALGIGGSTAMYSVLHGVVLDPFPYAQPDRLFSVNVRGPRGGNGSMYSIDHFLEIANRNTVFEGVIASTWSDVTWTGSGEPRRLRGNHCTLNTFEVMGVPPLVGRVSTPADAAPNAEPIAILGYRFWLSSFGADPNVLGRKLNLNGTLRTVVAVMPPRFMWRGADVYLPDTLRAGQTLDGDTSVHLLGRLRPGVSRLQAAASLQPILEDLAHRDPDAFPKEWRLLLRDFAETFPSSISDAIWILFGAVGLLLLIACVNVSNLLLARAVFRRREIAIRAALGAGRLRILRQLLAESLLLSLGGALLGIVVAYFGLAAILAVVPPGTIPDEAHIALNAPVLLFSLALAVAVSLLFGLAPALHLTSGSLASPLKESGRGLAGHLRQRWLRSALVVAEVALSLVLLVGASLLIRTLASIQNATLPYSPSSILCLRIPLPDQRYPDSDRRAAFFTQLLARLESTPGILAASLNTGMPPVYNWSAVIDVPGAAQPEPRPVQVQQFSPGSPRVFGLSLLQGRFPSHTEIGARRHAVAINETLARRYFGQSSPLGRTLRIPRLKAPPISLQDDSFEIVGVVRDSVNRVTTRETLPELHLPYSILGRADRLYLLTSASALSLASTVKSQVYAVDPTQPVMDIQSLESLLAENAYSSPRFSLILFSVFAVLGLLLALCGIYGVVSSLVAQQTREIGIRMALGATLTQVTAGVLAVGARFLLLGILFGLAASLAAVRLLSGLLRNVSPFDPLSFVAVTLILLATGLAATLAPARRAARVNPISALRDQ